MALDPAMLKEKLQKVYKAKKRNPDEVGTGEDIRPPTFYIGAPKPIRELIGGNYPGQRAIQFSGVTNSGKTTLGMLAMVEAQRGYYDINGKFIDVPVNIVLVDTEKKFSKHRFVKMGGDPSKLFKVDVTTLEEAYFGIEQVLTLIFAEDPDAYVLIVFDSVGNTPANAEAEAEADESVAMGLAAKVNNRNIRSMIAKYFSKRNILMMFINQYYGQMGGHGKTNKGGQGIDLSCAVIIQMQRVSDIMSEDDAGRKISEGIVVRANKTKDHIQTTATSVKELNFEIYAYEVKSIEKFKIKNKAEFVNDFGRLLITKAKPKDNQVTYLSTFDDKTNPEHNKTKVSTYEDFKKLLGDGEFTQLTGEEAEQSQESA